MTTDPAPPAGPVLGEEAARAQIAAIIATADEGTDMLEEIDEIAALVAAARRRGQRECAAELRAAIEPLFEAEHYAALDRLDRLADEWAGRAEEM